MSYDQCDSPSVAAEAFCSAVASAIAERAHARSPRAFVDCQVMLAHRAVVVAGELGFWPPLGAFEGVCDAVAPIVQAQLLAVQNAGWTLDASPASYAVINRLQRLPTHRARALAQGGDGHWRDDGSSRRLGRAHGRVLVEPALEVTALQARAPEPREARRVFEARLARPASARSAICKLPSKAV
ncbi:MAG: hypothetical protein AAF184_09285 [Pseudomonadota bacterium]